MEKQTYDKLSKSPSSIKEFIPFNEQKISYSNYANNFRPRAGKKFVHSEIIKNSRFLMNHNQHIDIILPKKKSSFSIENLVVQKENENKIKKLRSHFSFKNFFEESSSKINFNLNDGFNKEMENSVRINKVPSKIKKKNFNSNSSESNTEENLISEKNLLTNFLLHQNSNFKKVWDFILIFLVLFTVFIIPVEICFFYNSYFLISVEIIVEIIFLMDLILNFFTTIYDEEENVIYNIRLIILQYLNGNFFIDLISSFPSYIILGLHDLEENNWQKWLVLLRVLKLFSIKTFETKVEKIGEFTNFKPRHFKTILVLLFSMHIFSCFFIYISTPIDSRCWIINAGLKDSNKAQIYIASLYFNIVTLYTIGYGDIIPTNYIEKFFVILMLLIGNLFYSYGISSMSTVFTKKNQTYANIKNKLQILRSLEEQYEIDEKLSNKLEFYIRNQFNKTKIEVYDLISTLPRHLQNELSVLMYKDQVKSLNFFQHKAQDFILFVLPMLKLNNFHKGEILISPDEYFEEMYFVVKGSIGFHLEALYDNVEIGELKKNNHFGELLMQVNRQSPFQLKVKNKSVTTFVLKKQNFLKIQEAFKETTLKILEDGYKFLNNLEKRKKLFLKILKHTNNRISVNKIIDDLNIYLFDKGIEDYMDNGIDFLDANDFLLNANFRYVKKVIQSLNCFKENSVNLSDNSSNYSFMNSYKSNCKNSPLIINPRDRKMIYTKKSRDEESDFKLKLKKLKENFSHDQIKQINIKSNSKTISPNLNQEDSISSSKKGDIFNNMYKRLSDIAIGTNKDLFKGKEKILKKKTLVLLNSYNNGNSGHNTLLSLKSYDKESYKNLTSGFTIRNSIIDTAFQIQNTSRFQILNLNISNEFKVTQTSFVIKSEKIEFKLKNFKKIRNFTKMFAYLNKQSKYINYPKKKFIMSKFEKILVRIYESLKNKHRFLQLNENTQKRNRNIKNESLSDIKEKYMSIEEKLNKILSCLNFIK